MTKWTDAPLQHMHDEMLDISSFFDADARTNRRKLARQMLTRSHVLYHGSESKVADAIVHDGLKPHGAPGADAWAEQQGSHLPPRDSVFATPIKEKALGYATLAAQVAGHGATPVVFEVHVPADQAKKFIGDNQDSQAFRYHGTIPASWIQQTTLPTRIRTVVAV